MAVRDTMSALITRVRSLIGDPIGASQQFADQDVQDALDAFRTDIRYLELLPSPTFSGAQVLYLDYYVEQGLGDWEADETLWQYRINALSPAISDELTGHWTFSTTTLPPVYINGKTYDIYRAAAQLLERWAGALARQFDFTSDGQTFRRNQASAALLMLASTYRKRGRIRTAQMHRGDVSDDDRERSGLGAQEVDYMGKG